MLLTVTGTQLELNISIVSRLCTLFVHCVSSDPLYYSILLKSIVMSTQRTYNLFGDNQSQTSGYSSFISNSQSVDQLTTSTDQIDKKKVSIESVSQYS